MVARMFIYALHKSPPFLSLSKRPFPLALAKPYHFSGHWLHYLPRCCCTSRPRPSPHASLHARNLQFLILYRVLQRAQVVDRVREATRPPHCLASPCCAFLQRPAPPPPPPRRSRCPPSSSALALASPPPPPPPWPPWPSELSPCSSPLSEMRLLGLKYEIAAECTIGLEVGGRAARGGESGRRCAAETAVAASVPSEALILEESTFGGEPGCCTVEHGRGAPIARTYTFFSMFPIFNAFEPFHKTQNLLCRVSTYRRGLN